MKSEYRKGLDDGLRTLESILDRLEMDENYSMENAKEDLRDAKLMAQYE